MKASQRRILTVCLCVCGVPVAGNAFADERTDINTYVYSVMRADMVAACSARAPTLAADLTQALRQWRTTNSGAIARGKALIGAANPELGATVGQREASIHAMFSKGIAPDLAADPTHSCTAGLNTLRHGVPVAMQGDTLTGEELRMDLYQNARITVARKSPDSIQTRVLDGKDAPTSWREKWIVSGCGKRVSLQMTLSSTADGGTDFRVSPSGP